MSDPSSIPDHESNGDDPVGQTGGEERNDSDDAKCPSGSSGEGSAEESPDIPSRKRLYVSNLKWQISEERLRGEFSKYGEVTEARVVRDRRSGWSRGFGFVSFYCDESAKKAMEELNGVDIEGRLVRIEFAKSTGPQPRQQHVYNDGHGSNGRSGGGNMGVGSNPHHLSMHCVPMDPDGYCMALPPGYAYIQTSGQYVDRLSYQYIPPYYQPNSMDMITQQMRMMQFDHQVDGPSEKEVPSSTSDGEGETQ